MPLPRFAGVIFCASLALASLAGAAQPARPALDEQYVLGPDSQPQPGVPEGKVMEFTLEDSKTYPGFRRQWWLYIPPGYDGKTPLPVMVFQDGGGYVRRDGQWRVPVVLENLMAKKQLPKMAAIFVNPGDVPLAPGEPPRKRPDGRPASPRNRSVEYDTVSDKYATFLLEEIFPLARQHIVITDDPAGRGICGSSSGGICGGPTRRLTYADHDTSCGSRTVTTVRPPAPRACGGRAPRGRPPAPRAARRARALAPAARRYAAGSASPAR